MCRPVGVVHRRAIVHRDLKPSNLLIFRNGEVKLADFGAGRRLGPTARPLLLDYVGFWPGDTRYTPPELIAGLNDHDPGIARAADIYALGCILFELFSG